MALRPECQVKRNAESMLLPMRANKRLHTTACILSRHHLHRRSIVEIVNRPCRRPRRLRGRLVGQWGWRFGRVYSLDMSVKVISPLEAPCCILAIPECTEELLSLRIVVWQVPAQILPILEALIARRADMLAVAIGLVRTAVMRQSGLRGEASAAGCVSASVGIRSD